MTDTLTEEQDDFEIEINGESFVIEQSIRGWEFAHLGYGGALIEGKGGFATPSEAMQAAREYVRELEAGLADGERHAYERELAWESERIEGAWQAELAAANRYRKPAA